MLVVIVRDEQAPLFFNQNFQSAVSSLGFFFASHQMNWGGGGWEGAASC